MVVFGKGTFIVNESFAIWYDALNNRINVESNTVSFSYPVPSEIEDKEYLCEVMVDYVYGYIQDGVEFIDVDKVFICCVEEIKGGQK